MSTMGWEVTSTIALVILAFVLMPQYQDWFNHHSAVL